MDSTVISTRSGDIEYRSIGKGIPVVLIHGGHSNCFEKLGIKGFDLETFQLIIPSRPGYGRTPLSDNQTPAKAAELIKELLEHLSIDQAVIYGISAGGLTAIELAANYPEKVDKLILASAISKKWLTREEKIYKTAQIIFHPGIEKLTWGMVRIFSKISPGMIAKSFYPQFSTYPLHKLRKEDIRDLALAFEHYRSKRGFINDIDQDIDDETIKKVKCPTLIVHSKYDNSVSFMHAIHANKHIENAKLYELKNEWGHLFWMGQESEQSILDIIRFIKT